MSALTLYKTEIAVRDRTRKANAFVLALLPLTLLLFVFSGESLASGKLPRGEGNESSYIHLNPKGQEQILKPPRGLGPTSTDYIDGHLNPTKEEQTRDALLNVLRQASPDNFGPHLRRLPLTDLIGEVRKVLAQDRQRQTGRITIESIVGSSSRPSHLSSLHSFFEEGFRGTVENLVDKGESAKTEENLLMEDVRDKSFESDSKSSNNRPPRGMNNKHQKLLLDAALREFSKDMKDAPPELVISREPNFDLRLKK